MIRHRAEDSKIRLEVLAQGHDRSYVATSITVVRRGPDGNDVLIFEMVLVAFVDELVRACDEL